MRDRLIVVFLFTLLCLTQMAFAITDLNLEDYYNFEETTGTVLIDIFDYDNNGTNQGALINQTGKIGKSYELYHDRILLTNLNTFLGATKTVNTWIYPYNPDTTGSKTIWSSTNNGSGTTIEYRLFILNGTINFWGYNSSYQFQLTSENILDANNWYFVTTTLTNNGAYLYVNGLLVASDTSNTNPTTGATGAVFGMIYGVADYNYLGLIDETSVWNRILSGTDINDLYNAGAGLTYPFVTEYINVDFNYIIRKDLNKIILKDTSAANDVTKTAWTWTNNGSTISTAQDYNLTATELTDYNICLHVDTNVSDINGDKCYQFNTGDWTPPTTTFSSSQVPNTTDQNITLTCTDNNSGCKTIWYNINSLGLNQINLIKQYSITEDSTYDYASTYPTFYTYKTYNLDYNSLTSSHQLFSTPIIGLDPSGSYILYGKLTYTYEDNTTEDSSVASKGSGDYTEFTVTPPTQLATNKVKKVEFKIAESGGTGLHRYATRFDYNLIATNNNYNFLYSVTGDHNIQYFSTDYSDNNETIKTSNFTTYGKGRFYFKDENSGSDLTGVQVNFNGVDYNSGANNYLDFNFQTLGSTNTTYLFTLSKSGYSTRYYQTDLNYFVDFNVTFALLPESLATDLQFKMFPPTGTTALANTYIEFKDKDTNYTITRLKSNENGELTANLKSDDQNYLVWISEGTYIYQAVQLTILYPKDEQTLSDITGNWRIEITDNISYQDLNIPQGTNKIIYLLPNTKYPFTIAVQDVAGTYFKRKWSKIYQGNPLTDTLQPYLVNADDGIAVKFVFQDPKRDSIENIIINIYKNVGGIKTLISSGASDVTGNALFFLIAGDKYTLDFSYDGTIIFETQNYTITSSTVYWTVNLATREIKTVDGTFITIGFNPIQDYILKNATNISYKVTASGLNRTRAEFYIIQDGNKIITYTRDAPCTTPCTVTIPIEDLNITLGNKVYLDLNVYIDSNNYIFNYKKTWSYGTTSNIDTHDLFVKARIDFGCTTNTMWPCPLTSIVSIIIMILLIGSMVFTFNFVNPKGLLVAGIGILAVFTYLGWFWWVALVLIIIASIFYLRGD